MKQNILSIMILCLTIAGCSKDTKVDTYTISKKDLQIVSVKDIIRRHENTHWSKRTILWRINAPEDINTSENTYRISFPFKLIESKINSNHIDFLNMSIDLCKNGIQTMQDGKFTEKTENIFSEGDDYSMYVSLERLKEKHLISEDSVQQENICLYLKSLDNISWTYKILKESNVITFTADEINTIRTEYESLTQ